ncbi:hypothetical protein TVAG_110130 [Trichomonas vaginalis G3]|uniref:Profilin n=1 Tax=Trichomonas vaginalis (strain ATCC PRA-98 / G3) TaxID=412133 RepID=A2DGL4_TRIV3|nr:profilin (actin-binding protein) family [Trichomonas vaginalis G3]EAY20401.1 hypothetical protein TVAG_110130 [Trichomonas vaginalis G3]KAI5490553.1 profilin (actin-binding protein) family [Trichomonas vaginalis G3]|eukprot:XP_001581387.1 hypothetical protein [Trichomonas vaginalis G3]
MSWQSQLECIKDFCTGCAIIGLNGITYATEGSWPSLPEENHSYTYFFANDAEHHPLLFANDVKYFVNMMSSMKVLAIHGKNAIALHRTNSAFVAAYTDGTIDAGLLLKIVTVLADYLQGNGI